MSLRKLVVAGIVATFALASLSAMAADKKRVMVYGDSNSYGWAKDDQGTVFRLPADVRWPDRMAGLLGPDYDVVVEALGGRTTNLDCPVKSGPGLVPGAGMNGAAYLPAALASHMPLDLVVIMLGSNDLMVQHNRNAIDIASGIGELVGIVSGAKWQQRTAYATPKVLVLSPSKVNDKKEGKNKKRFAGALEKMEQLPKILKPMVEASGNHFFDVATVVEFAHSPDDLHYTPDEHKAIAEAVANQVRTILK